MILLPAIDLLDGRCVRLRRGDFGTAHQVAADPLETARRFQKAGAAGSIWSIWTAPKPAALKTGKSSFVLPGKPPFRWKPAVGFGIWTPSHFICKMGYLG